MNSPRRSLYRGALAVALVVALQGCTSFEITRLRNDVARAMPDARIGAGYAVSTGPASLGTARAAVRMAGVSGETGEALNAMLRQVRRVQAGVYTVNGPLDPARFEASGAMARYEGPDWSRLLVVRDSSATVWMMARERRDRLRDLVLVVASEDGLTLARLSGNLTEAVVDAVRLAGVPGLQIPDAGVPVP